MGRARHHGARSLPDGPLQASRRRLPTLQLPRGSGRGSSHPPAGRQGSHLAVGPAGCRPREGREDGGRGRGQRQVRGAAAHLAASIPHPGHHEELPRGVQHQPGGVGAHSQGHDILPKKILASKYLKMLKEEKREEDEENDNDNESDHDEAES
ncbi:chromatin accessibility complex protein 1 isoform X1 [Theropithecus gelada]|uniref:chromatin accessibility complex protein 1 isoform X1 n=1 Tax=Theropithecus gelada TaxID=9565 RepID=UPI000DC1AB1C|nr:chromatin accessibility complex protein 1 isoform X1 [Theropithecus gelada]